MISSRNARKQILENLRSSLGQTETYTEDEEYEQPPLRREQKKDYDGYEDEEEEEEEEEEYIKPKRKERKIPRRLRTPERKPEKKVNIKLQKFNECLRKLKNDNPQLSHKEGQKTMRQILSQLKINNYDDPEDTFLRMTKNN